MRLHVGVGTAKVVDQIEILWPSGTKQTLKNVAVNQVLVDQGTLIGSPVVSGFSRTRDCCSVRLQPDDFGTPGTFGPSETLLIQAAKCTPCL